MKRVIKASQYDIGDDYLQAKHYIDQAMQAMTYLQVNAENQADAKMFSGFGAQLAQMSGKLQGYLNLRADKSIYSSDDLMLDDVEYAYKIEDTFGAPQAGVDVQYFETWADLEDYLEDNPDVEDRISEGYARISECGVEAASEVVAADDEYPKGYFDEYYGKTAFEEYGDLVSKNCAGMIISKRADDGEKPGGLIYEAERLGIEDFFDLLKCLEGMCYNGTAVEISDYQYKVL